MVLDYAENIALLLANLVALLACLFRYISDKREGWAYATVVFLSSLMSCYYWTAYLLIMGDTPNVSNLFSYSGWNISYFALLLLILHMKSAQERRFFHPLMLLPIPLNIWQLTLYLPYGGQLNSVYQVAVMTAVACFSLQGVCWYARNRDAGAQRPYVAVAGLIYALSEFGMWTVSSVNWPVESLYNLYYAFSFLYSLSYLILAWAIALTYRSRASDATGRVDAKYQTILKAAYFAVVLVGCVGGILLGMWMRNVMGAHLEQGASSNVYDIIPVVLFIISLFLVAFAVAIIFVVNFGEKVAENNALREARLNAEHSNEAKSEFLANMSHEIRTPINAVLGMNEMIRRESLQARDLLPRERDAIRGVFADICDYSGNIESAGNNLLSIINDILDLSKIEAGRLEIVEANYRLSDVLNDVSNMIAFKARDKGLDFTVDVDRDLPDELYGDEVRVRQIITNVLNNAVKYTKVGGVRLAVRKVSEGPVHAGEKIQLAITVKDTGIGIREEDLDRLFKKFERVDLEVNGTVEGTGLGLAITRRLLDMMGGGVEVRSVYGEGSEFVIALPQKVVSAEPVGDFVEKFRRSRRQARPYRESFRAPDARVLVVDDTRMNLTVAVNLLKKTQIEIDTAISGADAVALCEAIPYDVILMDQRMPEMEGAEAMRRIRAQAGGVNRDTPFICLTADAVSGARERYLAEGFADYLTKPVDSRLLEQMLMKYLPEEKVVTEPAGGLAALTEDEAVLEAFAPLGEAGVDASAGLRYCQNDGGLYESLLKEYAFGAEEKRRDLQRYLDREDWKGYAVVTHAIKSTSRMIGAEAIAQSAASMEAAADAGDAAAVRDGHDVFMEDYAALCAAIAALAGAEGEERARTDEDEILEFPPEE